MSHSRHAVALFSLKAEEEGNAEFAVDWNTPTEFEQPLMFVSSAHEQTSNGEGNAEFGVGENIPSELEQTRPNY